MTLHWDGNIDYFTGASINALWTKTNKKKINLWSQSTICFRNKILPKDFLLYVTLEICYLSSIDTKCPYHAFTIIKPATHKKAHLSVKCYKNKGDKKAKKGE